MTVSDTTFTLYNTRNPSGGGTWQPALPSAPDGNVNVDGGSWWINPFYPATPVSGNVTYDGTYMYLTILPTPANLLAGVQGAAYLAPYLSTFPSFQQTFGYFEIKCVVPQVVGTRATFALVPPDGVSSAPKINILDILAPAASPLPPSYILDMSITDALRNRTDYFGAPWDATQVHSYGIDWQTDTMTYYIDREVVAQYPTPATIQGPMMLSLAYGVGASGSWQGAPDATSVFPASWQIFYIRAWPAYPF